MTAKKKQIFPILMILCLLGICAISCAKTLIQQFNVDEQYAITLGYRIATGEKMFLDLWEPHQTSGFVCAFFIKLYMLFVKSTGGIVIYLRIIGILLQMAVSVFTYNTFKKNFSKLNSFFAAVIIFALQPKGIQVAEFSNVFIWSILCTMLCLYNAYLSPKQYRRYGVLAALFACVSVLCYPSYLIVIPFYLIGIFKVFDKKARALNGYFLGTCVSVGIVYIVYFLTQMSVKEFLFGLKQMMTDGAHDVSLAERVLFYLEELGIMLLPAFICLIIAYLCVKILQKIKKSKSEENDYVLVGCVALILSIVYQIIAWMNPNNGVYMHTPLSFYFIAYIMGVFGLKKENTAKWLFYIPSGVAFLAALVLTNTGIRVTGSYLVPGILAVFMVMTKCNDINAQKTVPYIKTGAVIAFMLLLLFQRTYLVCETGGYKADIFYIKQKALEGPAQNVYCGWLDGTNYNEITKVMAEYVDEEAAVLCVTSNSLWYLMQDCRISNYSTISTPTFDERLLEYWEVYPEKYPEIVLVEKGFENLQEIKELLNLKDSIYESEFVVVYAMK